MTDVAILVPFRDDGFRGDAMQWITARWAHFWPDAQIIIAEDDGCDPFNKSMALNNAARLSDADVYVLLDADTWCEPEPMHKAISAAMTTGHLILPGKAAMRLNPEMSATLLDLDPTGPIPPVLREHAEQIVRPVGFLHVIRRDVYWSMGGYDERFRGWGGEDTAFIAAVETLIGPPIRQNAVLWSLYHPRPRVDGRRVWAGQTGRNHDLLVQYARARGKPHRMRPLVGQEG